MRRPQPGVMIGPETGEMDDQILNQSKTLNLSVLAFLAFVASAQ
jgi:hypothetical protein